MNCIQELQKRGFIDAITHEEIKKICEKQTTIYIGFDPTADSLHLGNMVALMGLAWFQKFGHKTIAVIGGATGLIGDPSGKSNERPLLTPETIEKNIKGIKKNIERFVQLDHPTAPAQILNNYNWFKDFSYINFLRDVGKHFRLGPMLNKDSVKTRLNSSEGMSYTEFSYQLLQGYDFHYLYENYGAMIQMGGSDQWGNITAGTDLIRKISTKTAYGATFPLLTRSDGKKFGKSEQGAIWLSSEKLSPYDFYQHLYRLPDTDIPTLMRTLTFMELEEISEYEKQLLDPNTPPNIAQTRLAQEITRFVHGEENLKKALSITQNVKPGSLTSLDIETLENLEKEIPSITLEADLLLKTSIIDLLNYVKLTSSKGESRRLIKNGGVYLNNQKILDAQKTITNEDLIKNKILLLGVGKKKKMIIRLKGS